MVQFYVVHPLLLVNYHLTNVPPQRGEGTFVQKGMVFFVASGPAEGEVVILDLECGHHKGPPYNQNFVS